MKDGGKNLTYGGELSRFNLRGAAVNCSPYGDGHINETYSVTTDAGARYILQKINDRVFKDVRGLMQNISLVTAHVAKKIAAAGGDPQTGTLTVIPTKDGQTYLHTDNGYFRAYVFIERATARQTASDTRTLSECAAAFGAFCNYLADFDASRLSETVPDFHNTVKRLENFKQSLKADVCGRAAGVGAEAEFVLCRAEYCRGVTELLNSGRIPLRVTHNDTKTNNVLLDDGTGRARAVIDLDTVMPGSACYDFGDGVRSGCNGGAEDGRGLSGVNFRLDFFEAYAHGYLGALRDVTREERDKLAFAAVLMTYECGTRFLTDYLDGDVYFRIHREGHNLDRARAQFKLAADMEGKLKDMERIIKSVGVKGRG